MKLSLKLPLAFAAAVLIALASGLAGIYSLKQSLVQSGNAVQASFAQERAVGYLAVIYKVQGQEWHNALLRGADPVQRERHWDAFLAVEREVGEKARALLPSC